MKKGKSGSSRSTGGKFFVAGGLDRQEIVDCIVQANRPVRMDDLLRMLDLSRRDKEALQEVLSELDATGRIWRLRGGRWIAGEIASVVTGVLSVQRNGSGFVTPDSLPHPPERIEGDSTRVSAGKGKYGRSRAALADIFVPAGLLGDAWHGDRVEVLLQTPVSGQKLSARSGYKREQRQIGRKPEGRIVRVLERCLKEIPCRVTSHADARGRLCRPADSRLLFELYVDLSPLPSCPRAGELLLVRPGEKLENGVWKGVALSAVGKENDPVVQEWLTKLNHNIPLEFPPDVLAEAGRLEQESRESGDIVFPKDFLPVKSISRVSTAEPQDLRGLPFVTIDGADARDFDDAIFVAPVQGARTHDGQVADGEANWELWVAIADVSHFVTVGSALDREARARGNSCYFPTSVEPMLPEILSNGLCSLVPGEDRPVMATRIDFDAAGNPLGAVFFPGVIRSAGRLVYEQVQAAFDGGDVGHENTNDGSGAASGNRSGISFGAVPDPERHNNLLVRYPWLLDARRLAEVLVSHRREQGGLDFDLPEPEFVVDREERVVTAIVRRERLFAHRLIEAFMLAANEAVARFLTMKGIPFPRRVHPAPDPERLQSTIRTLEVNGLVPSFKPGKKTSQNVPVSKQQARLFGRILDASRGTPGGFVVARLLLRSMMQARYSPESGEHFGLATACYCHFTSPIRRYADLLVHRALKYALGENEIVFAGGKLLAIADQCNVRERAAADAEREVTRRLGCLLLQDRIGEHFSGVVSGVSSFGFFVELDCMPVEGMVSLESMQNDWYEYDSERQELVGVATGRKIRPGQQVNVRLADANVGKLEIGFVLVLPASKKGKNLDLQQVGKKHVKRRSHGGGDGEYRRAEKHSFGRTQ